MSCAHLLNAGTAAGIVTFRWMPRATTFHLVGRGRVRRLSCQASRTAAPPPAEAAVRSPGPPTGCPSAGPSRAASGPVHGYGDGRQPAHVDHGGPRRVLALLAVVAVGVAGPLGGRPASSPWAAPVNQPTGRGVCARVGISIRSHCRVLGDGVALELPEESQGFVDFGRAALLRPPPERPGQRCQQRLALGSYPRAPDAGSPGRGERVGVAVVIADRGFRDAVWPAASSSSCPR